MITFSKQDKEELISKIKQYFNDELEQEIGGFDAEFLLDFISNEIGCHYYNQALADVKGLFERQLDTLADSIFQLEQSAPRRDTSTN